MTDPFAIEQTMNLVNWFNDNLDSPDRFSRTSEKYIRYSDTKGLSWFKSSANDHITKAFELKSVLDQSGYYIDVLKETRLGYVVYEDLYQVVAEPFSETAI